MIIKGDFLQVGDKVIFQSRCSVCNEPADELSGQEVSALVTGKWGPVLCKNCQDNTCPTCGFTMIGTRAITYLKEVGECYFCRVEREEKSNSVEAVLCDGCHRVDCSCEGAEGEDKFV